ncbi:MAG: hypothetical protein DRH57_05210 [Candidatus Cloacimonadota bacterium]|nr:MAG: hypothetical protein DRH57_05210 [Candidatus Cloacimonadota bacterium]
MKKFILALLVIISVSSLVIAKYIDYDIAFQMLSEVKSSDFPEADQISIENTQIYLDEHCLGTYKYDSYRKILTEKAKRWNTVRFWYNSMYDTVIVNQIEIIKPDGKRVSFEPDEILKLTQNAFMKSANIYSETRWTLTGELPDLNVDDIIHTVQTRISHNTGMEDNFFDRISVEHYSPVLKEYYELNLPKSIKLNIHHINEKDGFVEFAQREDEDRKIYCWDIDCAPHIIYEPNMENDDKFAYYIMLTTVDNWKDISRWYYSLVAPHLETDDEMKAKVDELIADAKTKEEKISKIFYWTAQKIRYLGVDKEKNRPGLEPHDVTYTFSTRGGVCRDKAALLVAMFRLAGIPSDPILISAGYQLNPVAPVMWFNHAITVTYDENGKPEYFFDPTSENTKDYLPQYEEDSSYIIASEQGDTLRIIPISPCSRNNTTININIDVDKNKNANCSVKIVYSGLGDTFIRSRLMRMTPEKKKEMIEQKIATIHALAELIDYTITDPNNKNENISIYTHFTIPNYVEEQGNFIFIPLEASKLSLSFIYGYQLNAFQLSERKYPFKLPNTFSVNIIEDIKLPSSFVNISLPEIHSIDYKGFSLTKEHNFREDNTRLIFSCSFSVDRIHFRQEDFLPLKAELGRLEQLEKLYIIGQK